MKFSTMRNFSWRKISSGRLVNPSQDWQNICRFLESGEYGRAAVSLQQLQDNFKGTAREELKIILSAAMQICLACAQLKLEEKRCRDAIQDTHQREQALQAELGKLVRQMMDWEDEQARSSDNDSGMKALKFVQGTVQKKFIQRLWGPKHYLDEKNRVEDPMVSFSAKAEEVVLPSLSEVKRQDELNQHQLFIFCLGVFQVYLDGHVGVNWPNSKGKSIFKYLIAHKEQPVAKEVLMELFWRDSPPDSARRNLNWSIHSLRQALHRNQPDFSHVVFESECYRLNPDLQIWMDVDEFKAHLHKAQGLEEVNNTALAMSEYQAAEILYQGEFLEEDRYEDLDLPVSPKPAKRLPELAGAPEHVLL